MSKKSQSQRGVPLSNTFGSLGVSSEEDQGSLSHSQVLSRMNEQDERITSLAEKMDLLISLVSPQSNKTNDKSKNINKDKEVSLHTDNEDTDDIISLSDDNGNEFKMNNKNSNDKFTTPKTAVATAIPSSSSSLTRNTANHDSPTHSISQSNPFNGDMNGNSKLPALKEIPIGGITADEYIEWRRKLLHNVSRIPKYNTILTEEPVSSWEYLRNTYANLPPNVLEKMYLDYHQVLSAYIYGAIPNAVEVMTQSKMKEDPSLYHLPTLLHFRMTKGEFNAYGLLLLLDSHYIARTNYRLHNIMTKLRELQYNGSNDPRVFISQYRELHNQGKLLVPCWPQYEEEYLAHDILLKLSSQLDSVKVSIMDRGLDHPKNVHEVEEALNAWWIRKTNKMMRTASVSTDESDIAVSTSDENDNMREHEESTEESERRDSHSSSHVAAAATSKYSRNTDRRKGREFNKNIDNREEEEEEHLRIGCVFTSRNTQSDSVATVMTDKILPNDILIDSGASVSITGQQHQLKEKTLTKKIRITGFDGRHGVASDTKGVLRLTPKLLLANVRHVPSCAHSLMSVGQVAKNGYSMIFTEEGSYLLPPKFFLPNEVQRIKDKSMFSAKKIGNLYVKRILKDDSIDTEMKEPRRATYNSTGEISKTSRENSQIRHVSTSVRPSGNVSIFDHMDRKERENYKIGKHSIWNTNS